MTAACTVCLDGVPLRGRFPDPAWLAALVALADCGSYRAAGKALGVSRISVYRRIQALGQHLGCGELVAEGGTITSAGHLAIPGARRMLAELAPWAR